MRDPIEDVLFNIFANPDYCDDQARQNMWAILEGVSRMDGQRHWRWRAIKARTDYHCARGCKIKWGTVYFKAPWRASWARDLQLCARCMAMLLYFKGINNYPPKHFTHWDRDQDRPVLINRAGELEDSAPFTFPDKKPTKKPTDNLITRSLRRQQKM